MSGYWLAGATHVDLSKNHGYGPFKQQFLGVVAHVNQGSTTDAFFAASTNVCPNFQVYADGSIHQYLPLNWQPWCQTAGNQQYAAIESAGWNTDPWTNAQLESVALILAAYREELGLAMQLADAPGQRGFGWHGMGGNAWGGHPFCPGEPRKAQRAQALTLAAGLSPAGGGTPIPNPSPQPSVPEDTDMSFRIVQDPRSPAQWAIGDTWAVGMANGGETAVWQSMPDCLTPTSVDAPDAAHWDQMNRRIILRQSTDGLGLADALSALIAAAVPAASGDAGNGDGPSTDQITAAVQAGVAAALAALNVTSTVITTFTEGALTA